MSLIKRNKFNTQKSSIVTSSLNNNQNNMQANDNAQQMYAPLSKDVSVETGFIQHYTDEQLINNLIQSKKAIKGKLMIPPTGYKSGVVETSIGKIQIQNRQALNRALHGDIVTVILLGYEEKSDQIMKWDIENNNKQHNKQNEQLNDQSITPDQQLDHQQYQMMGYIIQIIERKKQTIECLYDPSRSGLRSLYMNPIDLRFPQIEVNNTFTSLPAQNQIFNVEITMWSISQLGPAGVIRSEGRKLDMSSLNEIAELTLQQYGIPYPYKGPLCTLRGYEKHLEEIKTAENNFMEAMKLSYDDLFTLKQEYLNDISKLLNHLSQDSVRETLQKQGRTDLTHKPVVTIDPATAKDFDDAMHIDVVMQNGDVLSPGEVVRRYFKNGEFSLENYNENVQVPISESEALYMQLDNFQDFQKKYLTFLDKNVAEYEVGVHIADVTSFVEQNSQLDKMASELTTSIYLTDRCCPMYPFELADGLCSLNPCVPRYSFTSVFRLNKNAELTPQIVWFGHTLVVSKARLDYVAAQAILDGKFKISENTLSAAVAQEGNKDINWPVARNYRGDVICSVPIINFLAKKLYMQRSNLKAMQIESCQARWNVSVKSNNKYEVEVYKPEKAHDAHELIAEFMILTNQLVAFRVVQSFPICSVLRRHQTPKVQFPYADLLKKQNFSPVNYSTGKSLTNSVSNLTKAISKRFSKDLNFKVFSQYEAASIIVQNIAMSNGLTRAEYISGISDKRQLVAHWGIHALLYTHFTSPIRRYADDLVHRMLHIALKLEEEAYGNPVERKTDQQQKSYVQNAEFQYLPHRLIIDEPISIYELINCLPNKKLAKLADQRNPLNQSTVRNKKQEKIFQSGKTLVENIEQGKLGLDLRSSQKIKQELHKQVQQIIAETIQNKNQNAENETLERDEYYEDQKESLVDKIYDKVLDTLKEQLHYTISDLRNFTDRCNMNMKAEDMCEEQHRIYMLVLYILCYGKKPMMQIDVNTDEPQSQQNTITRQFQFDNIKISGPIQASWKSYILCKAVLITGEKLLNFTIIDFNISFQIRSQTKQKENGVFLVKINQNIPLNKQQPLKMLESDGNDDDVEMFQEDDAPGVVIQEFTIMKIFDVVILTTGMMIDQVDIYQVQKT